MFLYSRPCLAGTLQLPRSDMTKRGWEVRQELNGGERLMDPVPFTFGHFEGPSGEPTELVKSQF